MCYIYSLQVGEKNKVVCVHITSDNNGRFGFNVKGGSDLGLPIFISRVVPNTAAYKAEPKLSEGDQVMTNNYIFNRL